MGKWFRCNEKCLRFGFSIFITTLRFTIASILIGVIFFKQIIKINIKDLKAGFIIGFFLYVAFATQTVGLQYTTAGKQAFLTGTNVVMVPFIYWLVSGRKPDIYNLISAFLCLLGISLLTLNGSIYINLGDLLTLICALFFACHIVSVGHFAENHNPIILTFIQFLIASILSFISMILIEGSPASISKEGIIPVGYLAIFSTLIAFLIQNIAQKYTSATHTAIILSLEAVFGSILSCVLLGEKFTYKIFIGCIIIFIAIITAETKLEFLKFNKKTITSSEKLSEKLNS
ncbi:transporter [Clostridium tetanomorphum]|nr:transporter [Clostridium tetanomorphum]